MNGPSLDEVGELYSRYGQDHYDEELSQLAHALQTAALAERAGASDALVAAALLHDVGHLLELQGRARGGDEQSFDRRHERTGPAYLSGLFPAEVTDPIALHVEAKRYLCATDAGYRATLSQGSTASLERQGGPMKPEELETFEQRPGFADAVTLRRWDDLGKVDGLIVEGYGHYLPTLERLALG